MGPGQKHTQRDWRWQPTKTLLERSTSRLSYVEKKTYRASAFFFFCDKVLLAVGASRVGSPSRRAASRCTNTPVSSCLLRSNCTISRKLETTLRGVFFFFSPCRFKRAPGKLLFFAITCYNAVCNALRRPRSAVDQRLPWIQKGPTHCNVVQKGRHSHRELRTRVGFRDSLFFLLLFFFCFFDADSLSVAELCSRLHAPLGNTGPSATADAYRPTVERPAFQLPRARPVVVSRACATAYSGEPLVRLRRSYARGRRYSLRRTCASRAVKTRTSFFFL